MKTNHPKLPVKNLEYYLSLPWTYKIEPDKDNDGNRIFVIRVDEFPEISSDGYTPEEAMESIQEVLALVIELSLKDGEEIPVPPHSSS